MSTGETVCQNMPILTEDEIDDALFRGRDRAWAAAAGMFDHKRETQKLTYQGLANRIDRRKSQVHYWFSGARNMTLKTLGLLAEGMDTDLEIRLVPRMMPIGNENYCHPSTMAASMIVMKTIPDQVFGDLANPLKSSFMNFSVDVEDA